jgi:hypothetical protein
MDHFQRAIDMIDGLLAHFSFDADEMCHDNLWQIACRNLPLRALTTLETLWLRRKSESDP